MCCLGAASCCCSAWGGKQGDLFAFLLTPCCLHGWHRLVHGAAWCCGMQLAIPRTSPWSCSRGINHGCAAAALGAPSLLGGRLQLLLLSLLCPPQHEPWSSSSSQPCLHAAGFVLPWGCRSFLLGGSCVLSRWQESLGRIAG